MRFHLIRLMTSIATLFVIALLATPAQAKGALRDLAPAYAKSGQTRMAAPVTSQRHALNGRIEDAGPHTKRASHLLSTGSGPWQRAQDVLIAPERAEKRK